MIVKETDVDFIGSIPVHWEVVPVKYFSTFRMGQTILKEDLIENGKFPVYSATEKDHYFGSINNPQFILDEGDIVIPARGNSIGHIKLVHEKAVSTQTTIANFVDQDKVSSKFLFYFYKAFRENLFPYDNTAIPQITVEKIKDNKVALPPISEQTQIADFLDRKTAQIDEIIAKKEKMLTLLDEKKKAVINEAVTKGLNPNAKMKDSGIEWIGEIPENWEVKSLKYLTEKVGSGVTPRGGAEVYKESGVKFIRSQNVYFEGLRLDDIAYIDEETHNLMSNSKVYFDDVLLNITGGSIGRSCVVKYNEEFNVNQHVCIIRCNELLLPDFLNYFLFSDSGQSQIRLGITGGNREGLNFENLKGFVIPAISIGEQQKIIDYLNHYCKNSFKLEEKINLQIEKLKEYRQSLISEAVTGKIDVKNYN